MRELYYKNANESRAGFEDNGDGLVAKTRMTKKGRRIGPYLVKGSQCLLTSLADGVTVVQHTLYLNDLQK